MRYLTLIVAFFLAISVHAQGLGGAAGIGGKAGIGGGAVSGGGTISEVQDVINDSCAQAATCAITVASTGAGDLLVIRAVPIGSTQITVSSVTACGTWVNPTSAQAYDSQANASTNILYVLSSSASCTSFTVTWSSTPGDSGSLVHFREYHTTSGSFSLDNGGSCVATDQTASASITGVAFSSLTGSNDVMVQMAVPQNNFTAVSSPYVALDSFPEGVGFADLLNSTSGTAPTWTQSSSGTAAVAGCAFTN